MQPYKPARGKKNKERRRRNAISRRDHAIHEYTSWLAAQDQDFTVTRPPMLDATRTGRGTLREPGALVKLKARANRDLLDRGIGKLCEALSYKLADRGRKLTVVEDQSHTAMIPEIAAQTARTAKKAMRVSRREARGKLAQNLRES